MLLQASLFYCGENIVCSHRFALGIPSDDFVQIKLVDFFDWLIFGVFGDCARRAYIHQFLALLVLQTHIHNVLCSTNIYIQNQLAVIGVYGYYAGYVNTDGLNALLNGKEILERSLVA